MQNLFWGCEQLSKHVRSLKGVCMRIKIMAVVSKASRLYTYSFTMVSLPVSNMLCQGCAYGHPRLWRGTLKTELLQAKSYRAVEWLNHSILMYLLVLQFMKEHINMFGIFVRPNWPSKNHLNRKTTFCPAIQHGNIQFSPWIFYGKCWVFQTSLLGELGLFGVFDGHGGSAVRETQSKIMDIEYLPLIFFVITFTKIVLGSPQKKTNMKTWFSMLLFLGESSKKKLTYPM